MCPRLKEGIQMREWLIAFLMISLCFATTTVAQEEESDPFESAGLSLVALRNEAWIAIKMELQMRLGL